MTDLPPPGAVPVEPASAEAPTARAQPAGAPLDGNALAGDLGEIFAVDLTAAVVICVGCGRAGAVATLRVYQPGLGQVARCPGCDDVVLRLVRAPTAVHLDLRGALRLTIPVPLS